MSYDWENPGRKIGRPYKGDEPRLPFEELDRILVFGEVITCEDGKSTMVRYPTHRELARRYNVAHSLISSFSRKHNCKRRRREAQARIVAKAEKKLVEFRSTALALTKDDTLSIIDSYLSKFAQAVNEGRIRFDNPSDFNTMVRLKEFIQGGADSRQEIHAALSLEDIQARHKRMVQQVETASAKERGEMGGKEPAVIPGSPQAERLLPPVSRLEPDQEKVPGHLLVNFFSNEDCEQSTSPPCPPEAELAESPSPYGDDSQQDAPVARTAPTLDESENDMDYCSEEEEDT